MRPATRHRNAAAGLGGHRRTLQYWWCSRGSELSPPACVVVVERTYGAYPLILQCPSCPMIIKLPASQETATPPSGGYLLTMMAQVARHGKDSSRRFSRALRLAFCCCTALQLPMSPSTVLYTETQCVQANLHNWPGPQPTGGGARSAARRQNGCPVDAPSNKARSLEHGLTSFWRGVGKRVGLLPSPIGAPCLPGPFSGPLARQ